MLRSGKAFLKASTITYEFPGGAIGPDVEALSRLHRKDREEGDRNR